MSMTFPWAPECPEMGERSNSNNNNNSSSAHSDGRCPMSQLRVPSSPRGGGELLLTPFYKRGSWGSGRLMSLN